MTKISASGTTVAEYKYDGRLFSPGTPIVVNAGPQVGIGTPGKGVSLMAVVSFGIKLFCLPLK
jgi:hypothetical protein